MRKLVLLGIYNLILPLLAVLAAPSWLLKMKQRGGLSQKLWERLGIYDREIEYEKTGGVYLHAVSVGEVVMALKLINFWKKREPELTFVLAATTSTGYDLACAQAGKSVRVIYSPVDFPWLVRRVFCRFEPRLVVLVDSELWPNLLTTADWMKIPVALVNARLSPRSERRHRKLNGLTRPFLSTLKLLCAQAPEHAKTWKELGVHEEAVRVTGSLKFDPAGQEPPRKREEFSQLLRSFGEGRSVVLFASTHTGEEAAVAKSFSLNQNELLVFVPRHAERRAEVYADLENLGYEVVLRTSGRTPGDPSKAVLVVDTTGELRDWTAHAEVVVIGKSFLGEGGQNPTEAIMADKPVVTGPAMANFEPLITELREAGGVRSVSGSEKVGPEVALLLNDDALVDATVDSASEVLTRHCGATERTVEGLRAML